MRTNAIKKIVKQFAEKLKEENFPFSSIYLFGSQVKKLAHTWSDIDVAVVSDKLKKNNLKNSSLLWSFTREIDDRIEPHGFTCKEFDDLNNPLVYEIRTTGIRVV